VTVAPSVSVIVCTHSPERLDDLCAAVASVRTQRRRPVELLIVVDHNDALAEAALDRLTAVEGTAAGSAAVEGAAAGSAAVSTATAGSAAVEGAAADLPATVVASTGPKGLSGARNTGTELASGEIVAYLDDDARAGPDWLELLTAPYASPDVVAVGGWADPSWDGRVPAWFPPEFAWVVGCSHRGLPTELAEVRNVIGCNMSFRRRVVLDAGGFDVDLGRTADRPLGCEETELCIRIRQADPAARILLEPRARVAHRVPANRAGWQYFARRCRAEGGSKARVSRLVGRADGLRSERSYVTSVLPAALALAAGQLPRAPLANLQRMMAIVGGLAVTTGGYLEHSIRSRV
jgi:GT2 family glycosyltransferase